MKFREWLQLQEVGTGTNAIAGFARPIGIGMIRREPKKIEYKDIKKKK